jgi:hypothetical protein
MKELTMALQPIQVYFYATNAQTLLTDHPLPCSQEEVAVLEQRRGLTFPAAYREFLLWMGKSAGAPFLEGHEVFLSSLPLNHAAQALLAEHHVETPLPDGAIVFALIPGQGFIFLQQNKLRNSADPEVYTYPAPPAAKAQPFLYSYGSFTSWLAMQIAKYAVRMRKQPNGNTLAEPQS